MKASSITMHETSFRNIATDAAGKQFRLENRKLNLKEINTEFNIIECIRTDDINSYYYPEIIPKKRIVLHYTEGHLKHDIAQLTHTRNHVSAPFIIARDGNVYKLWEDEYWSYHIGGGCVGGNDEISSTSIAIELSNMGALTLKDNELLTVNNTVYCTIDDTQYYHRLDAPFRGYQYFASFTDAQYDSLVALLMYLTRVHDIPRQFLPADKRYNMFVSDMAARNSTGILSHVNFRPPGEKVDIGPAFHWDKIIRKLSCSNSLMAAL